MSRTTADTLALVNWKGVFFERYQLHRHVTALEGANGAGKTTVMIAAYVVLLPDMSRLRFTNLGETGATGGDKGLWGRLGEPGRPSYAVLDFSLPGKARLVAGVRLERKGEPSVEPTPFVVTGLERGARLQDLLLVRQGATEVVPELPELRENAARLGGRLHSFTSAREYFAALFEHGVTPLRLGTEEERNKLNEMLRTSMTGGISRALTSELRSFLLKADGGLTDTLQLMRANLDACRRTRTEVQEARRLEDEIGGVLDAGQTMFVAALLATRARAEERVRAVEEAELMRTAAAETSERARDALTRTRLDIDALERRRGELATLLDSARAWHARLRDALAAATHVAEAFTRLAAAEAMAHETREARDVAEARRGATRAAARRADEDFTRAAAGVAHLQRGLDELHRRAGRYRQATRDLREAEEKLGTRPIDAGMFGEVIARSRAELDVVDAERREAERRLDDAEAHRMQHADLMRSLRALVGVGVSPHDAHQVALSALEAHRSRETLARQVPDLERELADARKLVPRQAAVRERALDLGVSTDGEPGGPLVERLLGAVEAEVRDHEDQEHAARTAILRGEGALKDLEARRRALNEREPAYRDLATRAARLAERLARPVEDRPTLDVARELVAQQLTVARKAEDAAREEREALLRRARDLLAPSGVHAPEMVGLTERLGGELVAGSFEDVTVEEAGRLEARLGPLAQAIVVDDPMSAARALGDRPETIADVLLVARDADLDQLTSAGGSLIGDRDVLVEDGIALRVSRIPAQPRLGRRAREARAAQLGRDAERKAGELDELRAVRRTIERLVADGEALLAGHALWLAGDPVPELAEARRDACEVERRLADDRETSARHAEALRALRPRLLGLRGLLRESFLLDPPDHEERVQALASQVVAARHASDRVGRDGASAAQVDRHQSVLRQVPLGDEDALRLREHASSLTARRDRWKDGIAALESVQANVEALGWDDAPARLDAEQALVPALEEQLRRAEERRFEAGTSVKDAEDRFDLALSRHQGADGARQVAVQRHLEAVERFERHGVPEPTERALATASEETERLDEEHRSHDARFGELLTIKGRQEGDVELADRQLEYAQEKLASERREAEPATRRWDDLRERSTKLRLLGTVLIEPPTELADVRGNLNLTLRANTSRELLYERLRRAQGGTRLLAELQTLRAPDGEHAEAILELWLTVRDWLRRRLPAQVAEVDDPREALLRLRDQLAALEDRLKVQETVLRGASSDAALAIEVQVRKARNQVNRLDRNLAGVSFGSIQGIRVRQQPVEKMEQVLRAMRDGAAQSLLFSTDMPIEEALETIFQRFGGGRTGGQKILDYREYVHLQVEIRRKAGADWEIANPGRLSTGEAIGVGAALMMVVLTEWERDATLLRGKKAHGSLRFLFLDEANRLSHDNLGVLFDMCQSLDLQLLIAAPEVATAEGNTTYRLVRKVTDGREEVLVSGRRTRSEA